VFLGVVTFLACYPGISSGPHRSAQGPPRRLIVSTGSTTGSALARRCVRAATHRRKPGPRDASLLRDILADVPSQNIVDEGLIPHTTPTCFLAELIEHSRIDSNRDQLARFIPKRRATDASHRLQLFRRRLGNVREVNLSPRTPHARGGSHAAR
jgi:hypothetical protein